MITHHDSFSTALSLRRAMDQLFEQSFVNPRMLSGSASGLAQMDVCETQHGYEVDVALPGVRPEDIELTVDQNTLTLRGRYSHQNEHRNQTVGQSSQLDSQPETQNGGQLGGPAPVSRLPRHSLGHNWLLQEIVSGSFERAITFSRSLDTDAIKTTLQNGILTILLPVSQSSRPKRIAIAGRETPPQVVATQTDHSTGE